MQSWPESLGENHPLAIVRASDIIRAMQQIAGKRILVLGLGHFGGGVAAAKWLVSQGANVTVADQEPAEKLSDSMDQLTGLAIDYRLGGAVADVSEFDCIVASPAIPPSHPLLAAARSAGVPITTEIRLFIERCPAKIIGVTGTKGKSTTASLIAAMLQMRHRTWLGGNIGKSLLFDLPEIRPDDCVVLELSSYMLEHLRPARWSPHVAVITMIARDHLEWHGSFAAYIAAKQTIVDFQTPHDFVFSGGDDPHTQVLASVSHGRWIKVESSQRRFALRLLGEHNQLNARVAFAVAKLFGVGWEEAQAAVGDFGGLPHRLQLVHEADGVRWINDSIATIPQAAVAALELFPAGRVIQIIGGSVKKDLDMTPLCQAIRDHAKAAICIAQLGPALATMLRDAGFGSHTHEATDLPSAVAIARKLAAAGDVILLSPGSASYGEFTNFQRRGERFIELAHAE